MSTPQTQQSKAALRTLASRASPFARLRAACAEDWERYVAHEFVRRIGDGSLPTACFRRYLGQDYLFLIQFARALALAIYKSESLIEMRQALRSLTAILEVEMGVHVKFCAGWGLTEAEMSALPEAMETTAYTRFVLERGLAGDILDLHAALAPCIIGYAEIGARLAGDEATGLEGNPYREWIEMYAGKEYQSVARAEVAELDRLMNLRGGPARFKKLVESFRAATRLEVGFWEMGLRH